MDALASLLDGPRARGAFLLRIELDPPWSMRVRDGAPLALLAVNRGEAWIGTEIGGAPTRLQAGDALVALGPTPYTVADRPDRPAQVIIDPGPVCRTPDGMRLDEPLQPAIGDWATRSHGYSGVRTWGNTADGATTMLIGTYQADSAVGRRLIGSMPAIALLPGFAARSELFGLLAEEVSRDGPGQAVMLDRLLDLLLVAALREWFARPDAAAPRWYGASADPVVGLVLMRMVDEPAHPWTVAELASAAGLSRAAFARRFTELVGEPPMGFLAGWRLALAADLLRDTDATLTAVARRVGYGSPFALSAAFKRAHGHSPAEHRRLATAAPGSSPRLPLEPSGGPPPVIEDGAPPLASNMTL